MNIKGNIVSGNHTGFGEIQIRDSIISGIVFKEEIRKDAPWILPGFIDMHIHGSGPYNVEEGKSGICGMAKFLPSKGVTCFLPTYSCAPHNELLDFVKNVRGLVESKPHGARIAGSHLEGPWLTPRFCGGMIPEMVRSPDVRRAQEYLDAAGGTLKMMTIAPEIPGALDIVRLLQKNGVTVSCGHSACPPALLETAVQAGVTEVCHLFDCYEIPGEREEIRQPALTDLVLIHDGLMKEIIMDGLHVPPELVILARRAAGAGHIIAITDSLQGAGLPEGHFLDCGRPYTIREGEFARRDDDHIIVGSSLTMNRSFFNMVTKFGFTPEEAVLALSVNPSKQLKIDRWTGSLQKGKNADIVVIAPDCMTVQKTYINGRKVFQLEGQS